MPNVVVVVMPDLEKCRDVLHTWDELGVSGVTVLESIGLHKIKQIERQRDDLPLFPSLRHLMQSEEYHHRTAFVVLDDDFDLDGFIKATEQAVGGDFNAPNSGMLFVLPVVRVLGMHPYWKRGK
jgi:hypothetical protein